MTTRVYSRHRDILHMFAPELLPTVGKASMEDLEQAIESLPPNLSNFEGQIAGHKAGVKNGEIQYGFMKDRHNADRLLKPAQKGIRGDREITFYRTLFDKNATADVQQLRHLVPHFYGMKSLSLKGTMLDVIEIEDITNSYSKPATIDIKIGRRTFGPDASADKIAKEEMKYPQQAQIGFRILGYTVRGEPEKCRDREWGFTLQPEDIKDALAGFFLLRKDRGVARSILLSLLSRLETIEAVMAEGAFHIFSSSLLICFEALEGVPARADCRMIDFSHVFVGNGVPDEDYLFGIRHLMKNVRDILAEIEV